MTSVRSKYMEYEGLNKHNEHLEKRIQSESARYFQRKLVARPAAGRTLARSSERLSSRTYHAGRQRHHSKLLEASKRAVPIQAVFNADGPPGIEPGNALSQSRLSTGGNDARKSDSYIVPSPEGNEGIADDMRRFCAAVENVVCAHINRESSKTLESWPSSELDLIDGAGGTKDTPARTPSASQGQTDVSPLQALTHEGSPNIGSRGDESPSRLPSPQMSESTTSGTKDDPSTDAGTRRDAASADGRHTHTVQHVNTSCRPAYHPDLIILCSPFVNCIRAEPGMFFAFEKLISMRGERSDTQQP
jgi:TBC1 domain family member 2